MLDPTVIQWVGIARTFLTKALSNTTRKHQAEGIPGVGEGKPARVVRALMVEEREKAMSCKTLGQMSRSRGC